jgi:hypothetical protein
MSERRGEGSGRHLGTFVVQYINPVVLQNAMSALKIKSYDTEKIKVTIMPMLD